MITYVYVYTSLKLFVIYIYTEKLNDLHISNFKNFYFLRENFP